MVVGVERPPADLDAGADAGVVAGEGAEPCGELVEVEGLTR